MIGELIAIGILTGALVGVGRIAWLLWWCVWKVDVPDQKPQSLVAPICALSIANVAGIVALITFLRETGTTQLSYMWLSFGLICIPLLIMMQLITAKTAAGVRYADWLSVRLGSCLVIALLALAVVVVMKGTAGDLPSQPIPVAHSIKVSDAIPYARTKPSGILGTIYVDDLYPIGLPVRMNFVFDLQEPLLSRRWEILSVRVETIDDFGRTAELISEEQPEPVDEVRKHAQALILKSEAGKHYRLSIFLRSDTEYDKDQIEKDAAIIREGRGIRISDRSDISSH